MGSDKNTGKNTSENGGKKWYEYRMAPGDMKWGTIATIVFWIIIAYVVVYFVCIELRHLGCYTERQQKCVSPFYRVAPQSGDDNVTLLQRVENGIRLPEEGVNWRRNLIISIIVAVVLSIVYNRGWPKVGTFIIAAVIIYVLLYSIGNWYEMHYWYRVREQQLRTVDQLRVNLGVMQQSKACGVYGPFDTMGCTYTTCSG